MEPTEWQDEKRALIYAFTGDMTPYIERRAKHLGFKKTFANFKTAQIAEILSDVTKRNCELKQLYGLANEPQPN